MFEEEVVVDYVQQVADFITDENEVTILIDNIHSVSSIYKQCKCLLNLNHIIYFPFSKVKPVREMLNNKGVTVSIIDNRNPKTISLPNDYSWIKSIEGFGNICYGNCKHDILVADKHGKIFSIKYVPKEKIKEICDHVRQVYPDHIIQHDNYHYMSDDEQMSDDDRNVVLYCLYEVKYNDDDKPTKSLLFNDKDKDQFRKACENYYLYWIRGSIDDDMALDSIIDWPDADIMYDDYINEIKPCVDEDIGDAETCVKSDCILRNHNMGDKEYLIYTYTSCDRYNDKMTANWSLNEYVPMKSLGLCYAEHNNDNLPRWYIELLYEQYKYLDNQNGLEMNNKELYEHSNKLFEKSQEN